MYIIVGIRFSRFSGRIEENLPSERFPAKENILSLGTDVGGQARMSWANRGRSVS